MDMSKEFNCYFNSIKVRLEQIVLNATQRRLTYFNSIKVRLEQRTAYQDTLVPTHFNSIKVRLELNTDTANTSVVNSFQFHKGTIRTELYRLQLLCL